MTLIGTSISTTQGLPSYIFIIKSHKSHEPSRGCLRTLPTASISDEFVPMSTTLAPTKVARKTKITFTITV